MPHFVRLPSGLRINLETLVSAMPVAGAPGDDRLELTLADGVHELTGSDAPALLAAIDAQTWRPPGGPGPLQVELVAMLREMLTCLDDAGALIDDRGRIARINARALLARADAVKGRAEVLEGQAD